METKFIWVVNFGDNDFDDLNCAFDNFKTAKEAVQTIFGKISAVDPAWQNLKLSDEDTESEWAIYTFDYIKKNAKFLLKSGVGITVSPIPYNSLPID